MVLLDALCCTDDAELSRWAFLKLFQQGVAHHAQRSQGVVCCKGIKPVDYFLPGGKVAGKCLLRKGENHVLAGPLPVLLQIFPDGGNQGLEDAVRQLDAPENLMELQYTVYCRPATEPRPLAFGVNVQRATSICVCFYKSNTKLEFLDECGAPF